jgi:hypothetical protein
VGAGDVDGEHVISFDLSTVYKVQSIKYAHARTSCAKY